MRIIIKSTIAALALVTASPAFADIIEAKPSELQGTLVHGNGGKADVGTDITANLGAGPDAPEIVHFTGNTTASGDVNNLMLKQGSGQAELTGQTISGNNTEDLISGDIFLSGDLGMEWIELGFFGVTGGTVEFTLSSINGNGDPVMDEFFSYLLSPSGVNRFAFQAVDGAIITNLAYNLVGGTADGIRQVRISSIETAVPEPGTWAMMLLGFGAAGFALRRKRSPVIMQIA